ncbi:hypothetical protein C6P40_000564 [Pichia californica]|uniref:DUF221-domain-containing protein n=1 Tax=Pichia californica TaxID=460514 RepID=A0A9P7BFB1_9ASCO|nr:hypothetical protein C6P42_000512 [[Candida] californica]KAG0688756.1 hypothetical protein C6P40_000564 [[Candida] californica]
MELTQNDWDLTIMKGNLRDPPSSRMLSTQLLVATSIGLTAILLFISLRNKYQHIFMARLSFLNKISNQNQGNFQNNQIFTKPFLNITNKSFFNIILTLHKITDEEIIDFSGLDAYVFLGFFKMSIKILFVCWLFATFLISPIRYYFTGQYDQGDGNNNNNNTTMNVNKSTNTENPWYHTYLLIYLIFTYLFTYVTCYFLINQAKNVINKRQEILGKQNSITDRTIRLSGIPPELRTERVLKETIENLHIGRVEKIVICKEWKKLDSLFERRSKIIQKLELFWSNYSNSKNILNISNNIRLSSTRNYHDNNDNNDNISIFTEPNQNIFVDNNTDDNTEIESMSTSQITTGSSPSLISNDTLISRPKIKLGFMGLFGETVDSIDYYTNQLSVIDDEIKNARKYHYPATPNAFVTMDSVATAQTLAQAVLDPRIGYLISNPAPAPADIIWENATLPSNSRKLKIYYITVITGILGVIFIFPVGYLATLLNLKSIKKFWPDLAQFLLSHEWAARIIIDLLPVYLYTLLNGIIPFLYVWLSSKQGFISHGEEELSVVSKNFFYVFVNLFLVFTMAGTASNYWGYLSDSKKLALQLAQSLRGLSSFYVDTIVLQGIGLMPFKLLPIGRIFQFIYFWFTHSKSYKNSRFSLGKPTARELTYLYQPPNFNFGLQLPHPLLTLVITLIYSVISTKIVTAGLAYFIIGYYVYKFILIYTYIHPQHSTGKVMPIIFRRVILGLLLFQLTVAGSLVLEKSWVLAACLAPLPLATLMILWYFQDKLKPLSIFIALRAIELDNQTNSKNKFNKFNNINNEYHDNPLDLENENIIFDNNIWEQSNIINSELISPPTKKNAKTPVTIDERREEHQSYEYPPLVDNLEGPWIGMETRNNNNNRSADGDRNDTWILVWTSDGIQRKKITSEINQTGL